jgi:hypothetical protein
MIVFDPDVAVETFTKELIWPNEEVGTEIITVPDAPLPP